MDDIHCLKFKKGDGNVVNSFTQWGIVCASVPFKAGGSVKELPENDWYDEHGTDVYIPAKTMFESYDAEFVMAYKGQELATNPFDLDLALTQINAFKKWLTGNDTENGSGAELKIYSPYSTIGRQGCYLKSIDDENPIVMTKEENGNLYHENIVTFKVTFRVTDPITNVVLS